VWVHRWGTERGSDMAQTTRLAPNQTWGRKHFTHKKYVLSGPPRDIVGIRDDASPELSNPFQRDKIRSLAARDRRKLLAGHDAEVDRSTALPPEIDILTRRTVEYYARQAREHAHAKLWGEAYWYWMAASQGRRLRPSESARYVECASSCLREWRRGARK
jgi:hypothetical protein